jgi:hypothetical protein
MTAKAPLQRVAYSPGEFATMFGKSQTWGYRQIYAGKVTTITQHGRILIPAAEVERILAEAGIYNGEKKRLAKPEDRQENKAALWKQFIANRRTGNSGDGKAKRSAALARLVDAQAKSKKSVARRAKRR